MQKRNKQCISLSTISLTQLNYLGPYYLHMHLIWPKKMIFFKSTHENPELHLTFNV